MAVCVKSLKNNQVKNVSIGQKFTAICLKTHNQAACVRTDISAVKQLGQTGKNKITWVGRGANSLSGGNAARGKSPGPRAKVSNFTEKETRASRVAEVAGSVNINALRASDSRPVIVQGQTQHIEGTRVAPRGGRELRVHVGLTDAPGSLGGNDKIMCPE